MHKSINFNLPHDGTRDYFIRRKDDFFFGGGGPRHTTRYAFNCYAFACVLFGKHSVHFLYSFFLGRLRGWEGSC